ncbi:MAG: hypothetical protein ABGY11_13115 [Candidatus Thioglobus sp.]
MYYFEVVLDSKCEKEITISNKEKYLRMEVQRIGHGGKDASYSVQVVPLVPASH